MSESPQVVPESWPPLEPTEPLKLWRIHWLLALPATIPAMLLPRRVGPHLASSSWAAAYVVHVFSAVFFFGLFVASATEFKLAAHFGAKPTLASYAIGEHIRRPLAGLALFLLETLTSWLDVAILAIVVAVIEVGIWAVAVTLIPLYAAGERRARLYLRCVKLLLWSTMCLIPLGVVFYPVGEWLDDNMSTEWIALFISVWALWWLTVLMRLGGRYAGPKEGPRWEPRRPSCEGCGYTLTGLPVSGRCPECGQAVRDSLPEHRELPAFARVRWPWEWVIGFWRTSWAALFERRFARGVSIWRGHRAARNHAYLVCVLLGLIYGLATSPFWPTDDYDFRPYSRLGMSLVTGLVAFACCLGWFLGTSLFVTAFGFRDATRRVVVLCYATAWLFVPAMLSIAGAWAIYAIHHAYELRRIIRLPLSAGFLDIEVVIGALLLAPAAIALVLSLVRLHWMLRETRHANG